MILEAPRMPAVNLVRYSLTITILVFYGGICTAQLKPGFTISNTGGCSPLPVIFTNTTSGASSAVTYSWDFGNGNRSSLKDPAAVFADAKMYTITLTVTDSNKSSSATQTVMVYPKPPVDLSASVQKGCSPLSVSFTCNNTPGIKDYFWDFGDGTTQSGTTGSITHTYTAAQQPPVSLTVTDGHGCQSTVLRKDVITVLPTLVSSFTAEKMVLCTLADPAKFINNSTGPGILSYKWDFGDGSISNNAQPSHVFTVSGTYAVSLIVNSSEGCSDTSAQDNFINAANFQSNVETTAAVCNNNISVFANAAAPLPDSSLWEFSDGYSYALAGNTPVEHSFSQPGAYTLKLTNTFGSCKDVFTKAIVVNQTPALTGFLVDKTSACGSPVKVNFKDTTSGAVKWNWSSLYSANFESTTQSPSYTFINDGNYVVNLTVTTAAGCSASTIKTVNVSWPLVLITSPDISGSGQIVSCGPKNIHFSTYSTVPISDYLWDFGYGPSSMEANPVHSYDKAGDYEVELSYTTVNGCKGTAHFFYPVAIRDKRKADFTTTGTICGNTPVTITNLSEVDEFYYYLWDYGDNQTGVSYWNQDKNTMHQYQQEGLYTITLIATNLICSDTIVKTDYIKVSLPFPKIAGFSNTCSGTRGEVTFNNGSAQVISGMWDFGDGNTLPYTDQPQVNHTYNATGFYKVVLSTSNGACTVKDSTYVTVLLKQYPVLSGDKTIVCSWDDYLTLTYSNLEKNPSADNGLYGYGYGGWYNSEGNFAIGKVTPGDLSQIPYTMQVANFIEDDSLRSMVTSAHFGCVDTTNFIPLTIKGPVPGFTSVNDNPCISNNEVTLLDTSGARGASLVLWEWNFGDGQMQSYRQGGRVNHTYNYPGTYPVYLTVTDAAGCHAFFQSFATAEISSLTASFTSSANNISPGTPISFTNTSQTSDAAHTTYQWDFGDGTGSASTDVSKTFSAPGKYIVRLIVFNTLKDCRDTAGETITVKYVNDAFAINSSFISGSKCPPVLVNFTNTSANVSKISWDFGDGTIVNDVFNPNHVFTKAGFYKIVVTTYSDNGTSYSKEDSVIITEPEVNIQSDILHNCTAQLIHLSATTQNASSFLWDFGDGSIASGNDTFIAHNYQRAGVYSPHIIATDNNGCAVSEGLAEPIVIDSLSVSLDGVPAKICLPKQVTFNPEIVSISGGGTQSELTYHWNFGTGKENDTSNIRSPSFIYQQAGSYLLSLEVQSVYSCSKEATATVAVSQGLGATISGPAEICEEGLAQFTGSTLLPGQPQWLWIFEDGTMAQQKDPPAKKYDQPGIFTVKLVVNNNSCADTVASLIDVHAKPVAAVTASSNKLCQGSAVTLSASGGNIYKWSPPEGLDNTGNASVSASPANTTTYVVTVTDANGCSGGDSVDIKVIPPFPLQVKEEEAICSGQSVVLVASGAATYQWINNTTGLNNTAIPNPAATPSATTTYTVTGTDADKCFTDTAEVKVVVNKLPVADAGVGSVILTGTSYQLRPSASSDVVKWSWSPPGSLSCSDCMFPIASPLVPQVYALMVTNAAGCTASDTVSVRLFCSESRIYIPNTFTPNGDGVNDMFLISGDGISTVHYLRIYNRWGSLVFERKDFQPGDKSSAWNGRYKGGLVPQGSYVYFTEMSCDKETIIKQGSVVVLY